MEIPRARPVGGLPLSPREVRVVPTLLRVTVEPESL
jgi:hypothetical protein